MRKIIEQRKEKVPVGTKGKDGMFKIAMFNLIAFLFIVGISAMFFILGMIVAAL